MVTKNGKKGSLWIIALFILVLVLFLIWKLVVAEFFLYKVKRGVTLEGIDVSECRYNEIERIVEELSLAMERDPIPAVYDQQFDSIIPEINGWSVDRLATIENIMQADVNESVFLVKAPVLPEQRSSDYPRARIYQGNTDKKEITLLINVDWGVPQPLVEMLDILEAFSVHTTFCVTGRIADKFPEHIAEITHRGHEIASHSYHHDGGNYIYKNMSLATIKEQIMLAEEAIERATGIRPIWYSPPSGIVTSNIIQGVAESGYRLVLWTPGLDTVDWQEPGIDTIINRVLNNAINGGIALMHPKEQTAQALEAILIGLQELGLKVVPLGTLLSPYYHYELEHVSCR